MLTLINLQLVIKTYLWCSSGLCVKTKTVYCVYNDMFNASELLQLLLLADDKNVFIVITSIIILLALSIKSNML